LNSSLILCEHVKKKKKKKGVVVKLKNINNYFIILLSILDNNYIFLNGISIRKPPNVNVIYIYIANYLVICFSLNCAVFLEVWFNLIAYRLNVDSSLIYILNNVLSFRKSFWMPYLPILTRILFCHQEVTQSTVNHVVTKSNSISY
jgi:hypothetical protein